MNEKTSRIINIAIDGTSGSGKSTAAKNLAKALGIEYIDTGAMYRAAAYKALTTGADVTDADAVQAMMESTDIDFRDGSIYLDGKSVEDKIRTLRVSEAASQISRLAECRKKLVDIQRKIASEKSVVMDGRDIGSNVLPDAEYKFFVTASIETRATRRLEELKSKGEAISYAEVLSDLKRRDESDMTRALNPLVRADGAIDICTDDYGIEETARKMLSYIER